MDRFRFKLDEKAYLNDLEFLVNIDSGTRTVGGIEKIAGFFKSKYEALGFEVITRVFEKSVGPCLEIKNKSADHFDLLLSGHMDTVFPIGTAKERPFTIKRPKAFGPGVNDMKGSLLMKYYALKGLQEKSLLNGRSLCIALNNDEDIGSPPSKGWLGDLAQQSKTAFILEPARANGALVKLRK